jgi:hypothetical protein
MQRWMRAQADYTRQTLDALPGYGALLERIDELDTSEPVLVTGVQIVGGRYYSVRTPANAQSPKLYVRDGVKGDDQGTGTTSNATGQIRLRGDYDPVAGITSGDYLGTVCASN